MTKRKTLILLLSFLLLGAGQRSDAQSQTGDPVVFAPGGEEFTVRKQPSLAQLENDASGQGRFYTWVSGDIRIYIYSDAIDGKYGLYDVVLDFAVGNDKKSVSTVFNGLKAKKFAFRHADGTRYEFLVVRTKKRKYIFETASSGKLNPDSRRFFAGISMDTSKVNPPSEEADSRYTFNSRNYVLSQGPGSGTGQGVGSGTGSGRGVAPAPGNGQQSGVGQGSGTGVGSGSGQGSGVGPGNSSGSGTGSGTGSGRCGSTAPTVPGQDTANLNTALKILSKPRANLTDAAKANNIQGTVTLRVTFLASGLIGAISPVVGLSHGLTEQAIAAARSIKFEPAKRDGVPCTAVKTVQYDFSDY